MAIPLILYNIGRNINKLTKSYIVARIGSAVCKSRKDSLIDNETDI